MTPEEIKALVKQEIDSVIQAQNIDYDKHYITLDQGDMTEEEYLASLMDIFVMAVDYRGKTAVNPEGKKEFIGEPVYANLDAKGMLSVFGFDKIKELTKEQLQSISDAFDEYMSFDNEAKQLYEKAVETTTENAKTSSENAENASASASNAKNSEDNALKSAEDALNSELSVGDMKKHVEQTTSEFSLLLDSSMTKINQDVQTTEENKQVTNQDKIDVQALLKQVQDLKKEVEGYRNEMNPDTYIKKGDKLDQATFELDVPVGHIFMNAEGVNPYEHFAKRYEIPTTVQWEKIMGRVLIGDTLDPATGQYVEIADESGNKGTFVICGLGGEIKHKLTIKEMPSHTHRYTTKQSWAGAGSGADRWYGTATAESSSTGNNQPHENMQPYLVISIWKRIS